MGAEDQLVAVAILGDVTIDLAKAASVPPEATIEAYAVLRDFEVLVGNDTQVELDAGGTSLRADTCCSATSRCTWPAERTAARRLSGRSAVSRPQGRVRPKQVCHRFGCDVR
jgi:hypothetical protein